MHTMITSDIGSYTEIFWAGNLIDINIFIVYIKCIHANSFITASYGYKWI